MQTQPSAVEALVRCLLVPVRVRVQMMALVLPVASIQQACDISQPAAQVCEDFCTSKCSFFNASAGETGQPTNITLYRITPKNVTGIQNKNTGDAPGDVSFFLGKKNIAQRCAQNPTSFGCFLDGDNIYGELGPPRSPDADPDHSHSPNLKQASSPSRSTGGTDLTSSATRSTSSNRYATPRHATPRHAALRHAAPCHATPRCTKQEADRISAATTHVEHGAYGQPMAGSFGPTPAWVDTRTFECGQGCLQPTADNCHDREQRNGTSSFGGGFSCWCDGTGRHNKSVGREAPPFHGGSTPGPAWWVPQCKLGFYEARARLGEQPVRCVKGKALRTVQGWDFQSVSAAACDACTQVPSPLLSSFPALPPPTSLGPGLSLSSNLADLSRSRSLTLTLAQPYPPPPAPHPPPPRLAPPAPTSDPTISPTSGHALQRLADRRQPHRDAPLGPCAARERRGVHRWRQVREQLGRRQQLGAGGRPWRLLVLYAAHRRVRGGAAPGQGGVLMACRRGDVPQRLVRRWPSGQGGGAPRRRVLGRMQAAAQPHRRLLSRLLQEHAARRCRV